MTQPLSTEDMLKMPNTLLYDPVGEVGAAYDGLHRLITERASPELVEYALNDGYQDAPWDPAKHDPNGDWNPLPSWLQDEALHRCVLYWIKSGDETDEDLLKIPAA